MFAKVCRQLEILKWVESRKAAEGEVNQLADRRMVHDHQEFIFLATIITIIVTIMMIFNVFLSDCSIDLY